MQYGILRGGQGHLLPLHGDGLGSIIQHDAADGQGALLLLGTAAQLGIPPQLAPDSRQHLHGHKGLGDVVIRAHIQAQHLVLGFGLGGEQDDGHIGEFPDFRGGSDAIHLGHHDVQQNQVDILPADNVHSLLTRIGLEQAVALGSQVDFQRVDDIRLVVADENVVHGTFLRFFLYSIVYYSTHSFKIKEGDFLRWP